MEGGYWKNGKSKRDSMGHGETGQEKLGQKLCQIPVYNIEKTKFVIIDFHYGSGCFTIVMCVCFLLSACV